VLWDLEDKIIKNIKMKKLIYSLGLVVILMSCKTSKSNCDAYGSYEIQKGSTIIKVDHCHIEQEQYCFYSIDTIRLQK